MSTRPAPRPDLVVAAELALLAVTLAGVIAMGRLFSGGGWLGPLAFSACCAHATAALARRRGASLLLSAAVMAVAAAVVTSWVCYWSTTRLGIPTGDTWSAVQRDLDDAWGLYQSVVAPTPAEPGFVLASCLALWVVAYIADWAGFRLWVPFEATLPAGTLFLFTALLGEPAGQGLSVALYASAVIGFLLVHRVVRQDRTSHWVADRRVAGNRSLLLAGSGLGVVAVVAGSVLWPAVPGSRSPGVIDPRQIGADDSRVTVSPLVEIRSRLVDNAAVEAFRVESPVSSYWRLTSLEEFDGQIWSSSGSFGSADGELPESVATDIEREEFAQSFTIASLSAIWLPAAYEPRAFEIDDTVVRYDEESATLIVDNDITTSDGLSYRVLSRSPRISPEDLAATGEEVPRSITAEYLGLPNGFSPEVQELAETVTADAPTPAAKARALQDYLRGFEYTLEVQPGHSEDALEDFLFENRRGYCEQFAGSFAAMARAVGIPSRVAVGFTAGQLDPELTNTYVVRGEYAHAWPEVYIAGAGWVPYEPTPGRGIPNAQSYTGVPEQQAEAGDPTGFEETPTTASPPITEQPSGDPSNAPDPSDDLFSGDETEPDPSAAGRSAPARYVLEPAAKGLPVVLGLVLAYLVLVPLGLVWRRARRRRRAETPLDQVDLAWIECAEVAAVAGFEERASDTHIERALRLGAAVPEAADAALTVAARLEMAIYSAEGADVDDAAVAWEAAAAIRAAVREQTSLTDRLRRTLDPRWLLRAWRRDRATAREMRITQTPRADLEAERELVP